jgi:hypothetical protein
MSGVINAVAAIIGELSSEGISKQRKNTQQGYMFRGIDDVLNALSSLYAKYKVVVVPSYSNRVITEKAAKNGGIIFSVVVEGKYRIIHEDGSEIVAGPFIGEAMDSADKATNKAMSAAYKYFALQTFAIPTEGDNDADAHTPAVVASPSKHVDESALSDAVEGVTTGDEWESAKSYVFLACKGAGDRELWARMRQKLADKAKEIGHTPRAKVQ